MPKAEIRAIPLCNLYQSTRVSYLVSLVFLDTEQCFYLLFEFLLKAIRHHWGKMLNNSKRLAPTYYSCLEFKQPKGLGWYQAMLRCLTYWIGDGEIGRLDAHEREPTTKDAKDENLFSPSLPLSPPLFSS